MAKKYFNFLLPALKTVFQERKYRIYFAILLVALFLLYIILPVVLTPGNSLQFQLSLLKFKDYLLMTFLSLSTTLFLTMQIYLLQQKQKNRFQIATQSSFGIFSSITAMFSGLLSMAACSSCIATILGFLGTSSVFFAIQNRFYILIGSVALILIGIYFSARKIAGICQTCS